MPSQVTSCNPLLANTYYIKALQAYEKGDHKSEVKNYKLAAKLGLAEAMNALGNSYFTGKGVKLDKKKAVDYYKLAAEKGNRDAQFSLGRCYYYGDGVRESAREAVKYYELSATGGDGHASYALARCYQYGEGVQEDYEKALKYYKFAVEQGLSSAQFALGRCYDKGIGVPVNMEEALKYYKLAANKGHTLAQARLGDIYFYGGDGIRNLYVALEYLRVLDKKEYEGASCKLFNCNKALAEQGDPAAQSYMGVCYFKGEFVSKNVKKALKYFKLSAKGGDVNGYLWFGIIHYRGLEGVPVDKGKGLKYLDVAAGKENPIAQKLIISHYENWAKQGDLKANFILGEYYYSGKYVTEDKTRALDYFKFAADQGYKPAKKAMISCYEDLAKQGDIEANFILGQYYYSGKYVAEDKIRAAGYFEFAADRDYAPAKEAMISFFEDLAKQGDGRGYFFLGKYYYSGKYVTEDKTRALEYFKLAFDRGEKYARLSIISHYEDLAKQGDLEAHFILGQYYYSGKYVREDKTRALDYFKSAAERDYVPAKDAIISHYEDLARQGDLEANFILGEYYYSGKYFVEDKARALDYFKSAADRDYVPAKDAIISHYEDLAKQGDLKANFILGEYYYSGKYVVEDKARALDYFKSAADRDYAPAKEAIISHYEDLARQGDPEANFILWQYYYFGKYVAEDEARALIYLQAALDKKYEPAITANFAVWENFLENFRADYENPFKLPSSVNPWRKQRRGELETHSFIKHIEKPVPEDKEKSPEIFPISRQLFSMFQKILDKFLCLFR